jgi:hypothetical protein
MYTVWYIDVVADEVHKNELKFLFQDVIFFSLKNTFRISRRYIRGFLKFSCWTLFWATLIQSQIHDFHSPPYNMHNAIILTVRNDDGNVLEDSLLSAVSGCIFTAAHCV